MSNAIIPIPQIDVSVREATLADVPFIDSLQREHGRQLGFLALSWIENKIRAGQVLVAEENSEFRTMNDEASGGDTASAFNVHRSPFRVSPVGYVIAQDKYLKREELGLIVQLCVVKGVQRKLVGATLLKAAFDRAAYGCRLFCLWCAQDIDANRFWEAMGFVPLAYRAGSERKRRVHLFWQKRIRAGDDVTPWWFPSTTGNGAMRADRIVLPIPPGKHWSDEMPVIVLPKEPGVGRQLPSAVKEKGRRANAPALAPAKVLTTAAIGMRFAPPPSPEPVNAEKKPREKKPKAKNDPKLVAAARELRDRWMEQVNAGAYLIESAGKYDVSRALPGIRVPSTIPLLPAA